MGLYCKYLMLLAAWVPAYLVAEATLASTSTTFKKSDLIQRHIIDLGAMKQRRIVRVLVSYSKTIYFVDKGRQYGTAVQFGLELEKALNKASKKQIHYIHIVFVPTQRDKLLTSLNEGLGDIVMANLTITDDRLAQVDFTDPLYGKAEEESWLGLPEQFRAFC